MKKIYYLIIPIFFSSCMESEIIYEYPDGISKPDTVIQSGGCGNIFVYQFLDSLKALTVHINANYYDLTKKRQDIELNDSNPNLSVILEISPNHPDSVYFNYCDDIAYPNSGTTIKYKATSGKLSFSVSEDNPIKDPVWQTFYYVTVRIENLHLYNQENNDEIIIEEIVFWHVGVGWMAG
jgi:hypothetical protein